MKTGILALGAIGCAVWLTMAAEPVTVVADHPALEPIEAESETVTALKRAQSVSERTTATFSDYVDYLTISMQTWAEEAINGRGCYEDPESEDTNSGGDASEIYLDSSEPDTSGAEEPEPEYQGYDEEPYQETLVYAGEWVVTFYDLCPECTGPWYGMNTTASGRDPVSWYTVAAGPSLPFGTVIYIEGFGTFEVMDRGVSDGALDILVNNHSEIPSYGVITKSVYIIGD